MPVFGLDGLEDQNNCFTVTGYSWFDKEGNAMGEAI